MWVFVVIVAVLMVAGAFLLFARAGQVAERETLIERVGGGDGANAQDELSGMRQLRRVRNPLLRALCRQCWSAGLEIEPGRVALLVGGWLVLTLLAAIAVGPLGLLLGAVVAIVAVLFLAQRRRARRRKINAQLPNYLGYLVRALTAGNTLEEGLYSAAMESDDPIRSVFLSVSRQVRLGASVEDILGETARVHDLRALHILAMSARVNRRYGGSMRRVIASLIDTIRQQEAAARELKALTGETRFSAYVVAAIPIAISVFFYLQNPGYYATMLQSSGGRMAIVLALLLEAVGLFIIWRMMSRLMEPDT